MRKVFSLKTYTSKNSVQNPLNKLNSIRKFFIVRVSFSGTAEQLKWPKGVKALTFKFAQYGKAV